MLNKQSGNMYGFVTHTWNPIKGKCPHECSYCYMTKMYKRYKWNTELRLDEKCLKDNLGEGNFIFVGSSTDMFANPVRRDWGCEVLELCQSNPRNQYLFQTKNPIGLYDYFKNIYGEFPQNSILAITVETDNELIIKQFTKAPPIWERVKFFKDSEYTKMITIEPIMDFDAKKFLMLLKAIRPYQVNIGADSGHNNLPEPSSQKVKELISALETFTTVHQKPNLKRLL